MQRLPRILAALTAMSVIAVSSSVQAQCCDCNCTTGCRKVCRKVCDFEEVEVVCWSCKCEDFCLPGCPDIKKERPCECCCGGDGCCSDGGCNTDGCANGGCADGGCANGGCADPACGCDDGCDGACSSGCCGARKHNGLFGTCLFGTGCYRESSSARVYTRKMLGYTTITKKVPVVKWELVTLCPGCCKGSDCCDPADVNPADIIKPTPADQNDVPPAPPEPTAKSNGGLPVQAVKTTSESKVQTLRAALKVWRK